MRLEEKDWETLLTRIKTGKCAPFLGAAVNHGILPLGGEIAKRWADELDYPLESRSDFRLIPSSSEAPPPRGAIRDAHAWDCGHCDSYVSGQANNTLLQSRQYRFKAGFRSSFCPINQSQPRSSRYGVRGRKRPTPLWSIIGTYFLQHDLNAEIREAVVRLTGFHHERTEHDAIERARAAAREIVLDRIAHGELPSDFANPVFDIAA